MSKDYIQLEFKFPNNEWTSGVWPGGYVTMHHEVNGERISGKYAPVTPLSQKGSMSIMVELGEEQVQLGNIMYFDGPTGSLRYHGLGEFIYNGKLLWRKSKVFLIG